MGEWSFQLFEKEIAVPDSDLEVGWDGWGDKRDLQRRSVHSVSSLAFVPLTSEGEKTINQ